MRVAKSEPEEPSCCFSPSPRACPAAAIHVLQTGKLRPKGIRRFSPKASLKRPEAGIESESAESQTPVSCKSYKVSTASSLDAKAKITGSNRTLDLWRARLSVPRGEGVWCRVPENLSEFSVSINRASK